MPQEEPSTRTEAPGGPFSRAWQAHMAAGWEALALPVLRKSPPPTGATGALGRPLGPEACERVAASPRAWNIGVRAPRNVVGIDVDAYGAKAGENSLRTLEAALGRLPLTVMTSRRFPADETSGIRWYRIPEGTKSDQWPGVLGQGIELIRYGHRYGVAPPSRVHWDDKTQSGPILTYLAVDMRTGESSLDMPRIETLPLLPPEWIKYLAQQSAEPWTPEGENPADWLRDGECARVDEIVSHFAPAALNGSRHDAMAATLAGIARLGAMGHRGTIMAVEHIRFAFLSSVAGEPRRHAEAEFRRALAPLAGKLAGARQEACRGPLCGRVEGFTEADLGLGPEAPEEAPETPYAASVRREAERMRIRRDAQEVVRVESLAPWEAAPILSGSELLGNEYDAGPDLIDGLCPADGVILLTAERKAGKTTLLLNVAKCLVDGLPFLGKKVRPLQRNLMLMDLELTPGLLQMWVRRLNLENPERLRVMSARGAMAATFGILAGDYSQLVDYVRAQDIEVLIIDPLAPLFATLGWGENENSDVRRALTILTDFAKASGVSELILAHHTGWQADGRARGASSFEDAPDNLWRLQRDDEGMRTFSTMGRMEEDFPRSIIRLDNATGLLVRGEAPQSFRAGMALAALEETLRNIFDTLEGDEISPSVLMQGMTSNKRPEVMAILATWEARGWVAKRPGPKRGYLYRWTGPEEAL